MFKKILLYIIILGIIALLGIIGFLSVLEMGLPSVRVLKDVHFQEPLRVLTQDGKLMAEFGSIKRLPVTLDQVPKQLIQATLATEDQRFFEHPGIDVLGLGRAAVVLVTTGRKRQGGSTITMQVARNFFLTRKKTYTRKIREILLALKIDHEFSKDKILELYFNKNFYGYHAYGIASAARIYYGKTLQQLTLPQMAMLAGLPKAPSTLNPLANPEAALKRRQHVLRRMLQLHYIDQATYQKAVNTPLTAKYHALKISVNAPYVSEMVRDLMVNQYGKNVYDSGYDVYTTIDSHLQKEAAHALNQNLLAYDKRHGYRGAEENWGTPNLTELNGWIKALKKIRTINQLQPGVVLTLSDEQQTADVLLKSGEVITLPWSGMKWARKEIIRNKHSFVGHYPKQPSDILKPGDLIRILQTKKQSWQLAQVPQAESAIVALDPQNGAVLALDGGFNYYRSKFNRAIQAQRQPGSSFKPFIYSAALDKGFTLASLINDAPITLANSGDEDSLWRPENYTRRFYGPTRLRIGLIKSRNLVSIRLLQAIGIPYALNYASRFGFNRNQLPASLSLALGTATVSPLEMAAGYAVFANGGYQVKPYFIDHIVDYKHKTVYQANPLIVCKKKQNDADNCAPRIITPQNAYLITSALQDVIQNGTGRRALVLKRSDIAGKTGTTNDRMDAWFCGYNHHLVAITWAGFDEKRSLQEYGDTAALPLWINFMRNALKGTPESMMAQPDDIVSVRINPKTGLAANANEKNAIFELFRKKFAPTHTSTTNSSNEETEMEQLY